MSVLRRVFAYCVTLALELSDESGYRRHLLRTGRAHSAEEWKLFIDRRLRRKYQNAKCC
jgi:hypothetical protein